MLIKEYMFTRKDGIKLYKTYSDENKYILQVETGYKYVEAIDVEFSTYTYVETEEDIEVEEIKDEYTMCSNE